MSVQPQYKNKRWKVLVQEKKRIYKQINNNFNCIFKSESL